MLFLGFPNDDFIHIGPIEWFQLKASFFVFLLIDLEDWLSIKIEIYFYLTGPSGARNLWPLYVKWKFLTFCGLTGSNTNP